VAAGTPAPAGLVWWRWAEERAVVADTHHDLGISIAQPDGQLDRVEAGVEGEQWGTGIGPSRGSRAWMRATATVLRLSCTCRRCTSAGAVHESGVWDSPASHRYDQPATMGCPAECRDGW